MSHPKIHLPKPHSHEMKKAIASRALCRVRLETAYRRLKDVEKRIELLSFQEDIESIRPVSLPSRKIDAGDGLDWGIYWKDALVSTIPLHRVKGLGRKRCHHIIESFRTVGDLEAWRIVHGFSAIPGFSKSSSANLEEVLIRWLKRFAPDYQLRASADSLPLVKQKTRSGVLCLFEE